jgi:hypothetical protein
MKGRIVVVGLQHEIGGTPEPLTQRHTHVFG